MIQYTIKYAHIKHSRIRMSKNGEFLFSIPFKKANDEKLLQTLIAKAEEFKQRKINKKRQEIKEEKGNYIIIFGEKIEKQKIKEDLHKYLEALLSKESREFLKKYSKKLNVSYQKLTLKSYKWKWWSCSHTNNISLNLKLVHLPIIFLEYVIVHEVCHIKEKNHSKNFWSLVEKLFPEYKKIRKDLKMIQL